MSIDQQTKMGTKQSLTPLELAHLSAALIQAGVVKKTSTLNDLSEALQYLDSCGEALALHETNQRSDVANQAERVKSFLAEFAPPEKKAAFPSSVVDIPDTYVPVDKIVSYCKAGRIKLSSTELESIGEHREWINLSKRERAHCIFLALTNYNCDPPPGFVPNGIGNTLFHTSTNYSETLTSRRSWLALGVPFYFAEGHIHIMLGVLRERASAKGKEGAEKKRRMPRAPKGTAGRYEKKKRDSGPGGSGKFKRQKV